MQNFLYDFFQNHNFNECYSVLTLLNNNNIITFEINIQIENEYIVQIDNLEYFMGYDDRYEIFYIHTHEKNINLLSNNTITLIILQYCNSNSKFQNF